MEDCHARFLQIAFRSQGAFDSTDIVEAVRTKNKTHKLHLVYQWAPIRHTKYVLLSKCLGDGMSIPSTPVKQKQHIKQSNDQLRLLFLSFSK